MTVTRYLMWDTWCLVFSHRSGHLVSGLRLLVSGFWTPGIQNPDTWCPVRCPVRCLNLDTGCLYQTPGTPGTPGVQNETPGVRSRLKIPHLGVFFRSFPFKIPYSKPPSLFPVPGGEIFYYCRVIAQTKSSYDSLKVAKCLVI